MNTKPILNRLQWLVCLSVAINPCWLALPSHGAGVIVEPLHTFGFPERPELSIYAPQASVIEASDGALYGMTTHNGSIPALSNAGAVFRMNRDGTGFSVLRHFPAGTSLNPGENLGALIEASDGMLYGVTGGGGSAGHGTLFKIAKDGTGFVMLRQFGVSAGDGHHPFGAVLEGSDARIYGTTSGGGNGTGTVYGLNKDGSGYSILHHFNPLTTDGSGPSGALIEGSDGAIYGTTGSGGLASEPGGTVYKLNKDGSGYAILKRFSSSTQVQGEGYSPRAGVVEGSDGMLYGTTANSTTFNTFASGTLFKLKKDGSAYQVMHTFTAGQGSMPLSKLVEGPGGVLYGTAYNTRSESGNGTVFRINTNGADFSVLWDFDTPDSGKNPRAGLWKGSDGLLYGTTERDTVFKIATDGGSFSILRRFSRLGFDGWSSTAVPTDGGDGFLYGTTSRGGTNDAGTVFKVAKDGSSYTILFSFDGPQPNSSDARNALILGSDGKLYGTSQATPGNSGTIYRLNRDGSGYTVLRPFTTSAGEAYHPTAALVEGSDGVLYGTASWGGASNRGAVFKLNKDGSGYAVLRSFTTGGDGAQPRGALIQGSDGALYGTTVSGGSTNGGTVFRMNTDGTSYAVLRSFGVVPGQDGRNPASALVEGSDGALYGTTPGNFGTIYKLNKDGTGYSRLLALPSPPACGEGSNPDGALVEGSDGALYGTVGSGGAFFGGAVFRLNKDGSGYATVWDFAPGTGGGAGPGAGLAKGNDGTLYGTTRGGSSDGNWGSVFAVRPYEPPLTVSDATVTEGDSATTNMIFTFSLAAVHAQAVSVDYVTENCSADGRDYVTTSGRVMFAPGETNKTVAVQVIGDFSSEPRETFFLRMSNAVNITLPFSPARGTIVDDDVGPTIVSHPQNQTVVAGESATFTVSVTSAAKLPITYSWRKSSVVFTDIILQARTCSFTLPNVRTNFTLTNGPGFYDVVVRNPVNTNGLTSSRAQLTVVAAAPPVVTTLAASNVMSTSASLHGTVNSRGASTTAWFEYGLTAAYGSRTAALPLGNASNVVAFAQAITELLSGTNYHYRVVATNLGGMAQGADLTFQTESSVTPPIISAYELLGNGQFRLRFEAAPGSGFNVRVSTNLTDWAVMGLAMELSPGHFEFTDAEAPGHPTRFYQLRSP